MKLFRIMALLRFWLLIAVLCGSTLFGISTVQGYQPSQNAVQRNDDDDKDDDDDDEEDEDDDDDDDDDDDKDDDDKKDPKR